MKIMHVVHGFLPHHHHGAEISTYELASMQDALGHDVIVAAGESGHFSEEVHLEYDRYRELRVARIFFNPRLPNGWLEHPGFAYLWRRLLEREQPEIVHVQQLLNLSLSLVDVTHELGIPLVLTLRDFALLCARVNLVRGDGSLCRETDLEITCLRCLHTKTSMTLAEILPAGADMAREFLGNPRSWRLANDFAVSRLRGSSIEKPVRFHSVSDLQRRNDAVFARLEKFGATTAISEDTALRFKKLAGGKVDVRIMPQTPDIRRCVWKLRSSDHAALRIGFVGKMSFPKGVHVLLTAFRKLPPGRVELHLHGGPTRTDIRELVYWRSLLELGNWPGVHFHSKPFDPEQISQVFETMDLLVIPSVWFEAYGRVVAEALASGIPVVCSDEGGPADVIEDEVNGFRFKLGDADALAAVLQRFLDHPGLLEQLSRNTHPPKSPETYVNEVLALYHELLQQEREAVDRPPSG